MKKIYTVLGLLLSMASYGQLVESWSYTLPDKVDYSGPAIADDGTIYIACDYTTRTTLTYETTPQNVFAINPNNTLKWQGHVNEGSLQDKVDQIISSPSVNADGSVYISGHFGRRVHRFNAVTGDTLRTNYINARVRYSAPAFATNGEVYILARNNNDRGVRNFTSDLITQNWNFEPTVDFNSVPAIGSDGTIYAIATNGNIYAINTNGTQKWVAPYSAGGGYASSALALAADGTIYASAKLNSVGDGVLIAYNPADGTEKWSVTFTAENAEKGGPAVAADGTVYLGNAAGKMQAFNPANGAILWTYTAGAAIEVVPAIDNLGRLYFGDTSGMFYVLNSNGTEAYTPLSLGTRISSPAAIHSDGKIFVGVQTGATAGKLSALTTSATGLQVGGWPMYGKNAKHTSNVNVITLSTNKVSTIDGFKVYPNPVNNGEFYIETLSNGVKSVQIFDMLGKQVFLKNIIANEKIKTSNLKAGVYILKVAENDKKATTKLVIK
jgi:outer membrane protein assembly factor BamB